MHLIIIRKSISIKTTNLNRCIKISTFLLELYFPALNYYMQFFIKMQFYYNRKHWSIQILSNS